MTADEVRALAKAMLGGDERPGDRESTWLFRSAVLLIAALVVGPHLANLRSFTGIPHRNVQNTSWYLRQAGIWRGRTMFYPWLEADDPALAQIEFMLQAMVGTGKLQHHGDGRYGVHELWAWAYA